MTLNSKRNIQVFLQLLVVFSFVESEARKEYSYFKLNLLWPNSYCNQGFKLCKEPIPQDFKVHGFWPYNANNSHAQPCNNGFSFSKSQAINWNFSRTLSFLWPNLVQGKGELSLWEWEWNKYGICSGMSAENYFYSVVKFAKGYKNFYHSLLKSGVVIPSDQSYKREILLREVKRIVGAYPVIKCSDYKDVKQISDISICSNIEGEIFHCPVQFVKCGKREERILFATRETVLSR